MINRKHFFFEKKTLYYYIILYYMYTRIICIKIEGGNT